MMYERVQLNDLNNAGNNEPNIYSYFFKKRRPRTLILIFSFLAFLVTIFYINRFNYANFVVQNLDRDAVHQNKLSLQQAYWAEQEAVQRSLELNIPEPLPPVTLAWAPHLLSPPCRMSTCFDHSKCSLKSGFAVYVYDSSSAINIDGFLKAEIKTALGYNAHVTKEPNDACLFLVLVGENASEIEKLRQGDISANNSNKVEGIEPIDASLLYTLLYWGEDGRNHVLMNLARHDLGKGNIFENVKTDRAMIVQSAFTFSQFRNGFDLVVPPILGKTRGDVWTEYPQIVPARRKYLMTFEGDLKLNFTKPFHPVTVHNDNNDGLKSDYFNDFSELIDPDLIDDFVLYYLKYKIEKTKDHFLFKFDCISVSESKSEDDALCGNETSRQAILRKSTFALILAPRNAEHVSTTIMQARLYEALRSGAIPVILGGDQIILPYSEVIDWKKVAILLPKVRVTEMHFLLKTFGDNDLISMRLQGKMIWERYLSTVQAAVDTIIATIRNRLGIPPKPAPNIHAESVFNSTFKPIKIPSTKQNYKEILGAEELPYSSPGFKRNYSAMLTQGYEIWNRWGDPFALYPQLPFDPILPSDAKFKGSGYGFHPINKASDGASKEFCSALGGDRPREQFTIVILTYEREQVLISLLKSLNGLPYLNKILIIWNKQTPPESNLTWPEIGVEVQIILTTKNSLNNRFIPYDAIETEAVLFIDDDVDIRQDEIIFNFRVWREHRDQIVGLLGRHHKWDPVKRQWEYSWSYYNPEFSMVLTGAAFVHRYYLYMYWNWMPQAIRDKVDEHMNCEDIALNFLVSHITKKPPLKVAPRQEVICPTCTSAISWASTHLETRHNCINFFVKVYGYLPLLSTQYRADSILYNTKPPTDKQQCFKVV